MTDREQIDALKTDLRYCHTIDEWAAREFGEAYTDYEATAEKLVAKGWCKQVEGVWVKDKKVCSSPFCSLCGAIGGEENYCHYCGAKMKGGE